VGTQFALAAGGRAEPAANAQWQWTTVFAIPNGHLGRHQLLQHWGGRLGL
jgi:hypothetical protein